MQTPPIRNEDRTKALRFANYLETVFQPNVAEQDEILPEVGRQDEMEISLITPMEVKNEISKNINPKKAPGFDLITEQVLKELPRKALVKLVNLINVAFRLKYVPQL